MTVVEFGLDRAPRRRIEAGEGDRAIPLGPNEIVLGIRIDQDE
jgi:hypothetical protein